MGCCRCRHSESCSPSIHLLFCVVLSSSLRLSFSHTHPSFFYLSPAFCLLVHLSLSPANESRWGFSVTADSFLSARYQGPNCLLLPYQRRKGKKKREKKSHRLVSAFWGVDLRPRWTTQVAGQKARGVVWMHTAPHKFGIRELLLPIF